MFPPYYSRVFLTILFYSKSGECSKQSELRQLYKHGKKTTVSAIKFLSHDCPGESNQNTSQTYKPQVVSFKAADNVFARRTEVKGDKYTIVPPKLNIIGRHLWQVKQQLVSL
jgi:hypothetical protein